MDVSRRSLAHQRNSFTSRLSYSSIEEAVKAKSENEGFDNGTPGLVSVEANDKDNRDEDSIERWELDDAQLVWLEQAFHLSDQNQDGELTIAELRNFWKVMFPYRTEEEIAQETERIFEDIDSNNNQKIGFAELFAYLRANDDEELVLEHPRTLKAYLWAVAGEYTGFHESKPLRYGSRAFTFTSQTCIILSIVNMVVESLPQYQKEDGTSGNDVTLMLEGVCIYIFSLEFILRAIGYPGKKVVFFTMANTWIDLLSILPFYLTESGIIPGNDSSQSLVALRLFRTARPMLRALRYARVVRVLKLGRHSAGVQLMVSSLVRARSSLWWLCLFTLMAMAISSSLMFYVEKEDASFDYERQAWYRDENSSLPDAGSKVFFQSIPDTFWWAVATLTTTGYGDVYPVTIGGKIVASLTMTAGLLVVGYPITILTAVFQDVYQEHQDEDARKRRKEQLKNKIVEAQMIRTEAEKCLEEEGLLLGYSDEEDEEGDEEDNATHDNSDNDEFSDLTTESRAKASDAGESVKSFLHPESVPHDPDPTQPRHIGHSNPSALKYTVDDHGNDMSPHSVPPVSLASSQAPAKPQPPKSGTRIISQQPADCLLFSPVSSTGSPRPDLAQLNTPDSPGMEAGVLQKVATKRAKLHPPALNDPVETADVNRPDETSATLSDGVQSPSTLDVAASKGPSHRLAKTVSFDVQGGGSLVGRNNSGKLAKGFRAFADDEPLDSSCASTTRVDSSNVLATSHRKSMSKPRFSTANLSAERRQSKSLLKYYASGAPAFNPRGTGQGASMQQVDQMISDMEARVMGRLDVFSKIINSIRTDVDCILACTIENNSCCTSPATSRKPSRPEQQSPLYTGASIPAGIAINKVGPGCLEIKIPATNEAEAPT
ncbi:Potassium voltage-gated channel protein Shab [Diplonema papillatum]|nr:Potassium voltage-gated channel protein Shab [Diplonema papillatum]